MDDNVQLDLEQLREHRSQGDAQATLEAAALLRQYINPATDPERAFEAMLHQAWAYGRLGRDDEAIALYRQVTDQLRGVSGSLQVQMMCDQALLLNRMGHKEEANSVMTDALTLAGSLSPELVAMVQAASAETLPRRTRD